MPITIDGVWGTPSSGNPEIAFIYLTISMRHDQSDRLLSAATPLAASIDLVGPHPAKVMKINALAIDGRAPMIMQPQGPHLILRSLHQPLVSGDVFPLLLTFEKAGVEEVSVTVLRTNPARGMPQFPRGLKLD